MAPDAEGRGTRHLKRAWQDRSAAASRGCPLQRRPEGARLDSPGQRPGKRGRVHNDARSNGPSPLMTTPMPPPIRYGPLGLRQPRASARYPGQRPGKRGRVHNDARSNGPSPLMTTPMLPPIRYGPLGLRQPRASARYPGRCPGKRGRVANKARSNGPSPLTATPMLPPIRYGPLGLRQPRASARYPGRCPGLSSLVPSGPAVGDEVLPGGIGVVRRPARARGPWNGPDNSETGVFPTRRKRQACTTGRKRS